MHPRLSDIRRDYQLGALLESDLASTWLAQFQRWLSDAKAAQLVEPTAMILATADSSGRPAARTVLLKGVDDAGFVFFTNYDSRKGSDLFANPRASLVFPWYGLDRQVTVLGHVAVLSEDASDRYFASRPYASQISACVGAQSSVVEDRAALERARAEAERRLPPGSTVPRPDRWGGFLVVPTEVEFWQGRPSRLHDRLRFRCDDAVEPSIERLYP